MFPCFSHLLTDSDPSQWGFTQPPCKRAYRLFIYFTDQKPGNLSNQFKNLQEVLYLYLLIDRLESVSATFFFETHIDAHAWLIVRFFKLKSEWAVKSPNDRYKTPLKENWSHSSWGSNESLAAVNLLPTLTALCNFTSQTRWPFLSTWLL